MIDNQQLRTYYASFLDYMHHWHIRTWFEIKTQNITKPDFVAAMRRWAEDINSK